MANTTQKGALSVHGKNPQVGAALPRSLEILMLLQTDDGITATASLTTLLALAVPHREGHPTAYLGQPVLERALFRIDSRDYYRPSCQLALCRRDIRRAQSA